MSTRRGTTLIELLITLALVIVVFTLAYQVLVPSMKIWITNQAQAAIEESSLVLETRMVRELERTTQASVTVLPTPGSPALSPLGYPAGSPVLQAFSFESLGTEDDLGIEGVKGRPDSYCPTTGQLKWQYFEIYYVPIGSQNVYHKIWPVPTAPSQYPVLGLLGCFSSASVPGQYSPAIKILALQPNDLIALCNTVNGTERQVAGSVTVLRLAVIPAVSQCCTAMTDATNVQLTIDFAAPAPTFARQPGANNLVLTQRTQQVKLRM